jgi:hypothetical protein
VCLHVCADSQAYLDAVFVDMMWYKAFSVWLILKLGYNVLFQDLDIIWFKDPFPYFHTFIRDFRVNHPDQQPPEAFLSDDGQRTTVRYAPFYANSGFYYLVSGPKTVNLAWNIMGSFDVMQSSGSHQNVFTMKLMEALDFSSLHTQSLHLHNFSNGATFHHEKAYFQKIKSKEVVPYMFHMVGTRSVTAVCVCPLPAWLAAGRLVGWFIVSFLFIIITIAPPAAAATATATSWHVTDYHMLLLRLILSPCLSRLAHSAGQPTKPTSSSSSSNRSCGTSVRTTPWPTSFPGAASRTSSRTRTRPRHLALAPAPALGTSCGAASRASTASLCPMPPSLPNTQSEGTDPAGLC